MKKIFFITAIVMTFFQSSVAGTKPLTHPPIPAQSPNESKLAIILLKTKKTQQEIKEWLTQYPELELRYVYTEVLNGFSVKGPIRELARLEKQTDILQATPALTYQLDNIITPISNVEPTVNINPIPVVTAKQLKSTNGIKLIGGSKVQGYFDQRGRRLTGRGVKVGVIDTGVDYHHPDLRKNYRGGHDLVDRDRDPMETTSKQGEATLHGTHVAGVIAANGKMQGVAPDAQIIAYRALGPGGSGTTEQVLAAIEQAAKDKVDIVNLSLGNSVNGPDLPISMALNKLTDKGIVAVTSSGNSGPNKWTVGSPGTASKAISVGASTPQLKIPYLLVEGIREKIRLEPMVGAQGWLKNRTQVLTDGGIGEKEQLKNAKGKIVLIERGKLTFTEKALHAQEAGAKGVIIYNNTDGEFTGNLQVDVGIPVASISKKGGHQVKAQLKRGRNHLKIIEQTEQDALASFSSRGPVTRTWEIKPDVLAPGVAIESTVPGGYLSLQGTSMAAPHVAGACALIKQIHPNWTPSQIKAAIMNTAIPVVNERGEPYRTFEQGAGRIQIAEAIQTETLIKPGSLQFGQYQLTNPNKTHFAKLTIQNVSKRPIRYSFSIPRKTRGLNWQVPMSFSLEPNEKRDVKIKLEVDPTNFSDKIQDGYLYIHANGKKQHIPFMYVLEEPDYPRVMGFEFGAGDKTGTLRYQVYLPGGAEEFGIALFDPEDYRFIGFLDWQRDVKKGMLEKQFPAANVKPGTYLAKIFAKKAKREDMLEKLIEIPNSQNRK